MDVTYRDTPLTKLSSDLAVLLHYEGTKTLKGDASALDKQVRGAIKNLAATKDLPGKYKETRTLLGLKGAVKRVLVVGLGKKKDVTLDRIRTAAAIATNEANTLGAKNMTLLFPDTDRTELDDELVATAMTEGPVLANYKFTRYKSTDDNNKATLTKTYVHAPGHGEKTAMRAAVKRGTILAESANFTRSLANTPGSDLPPRLLAKAAQDLAKELGRRVTAQVFTMADLKKMKAGGIIGVGKGSHEEPRLIILTYKGPKAPDDGGPICLVGKGVTFDTGGISIKPSQDMDKMKYDMHGAASVLGAVRAVALMELPGTVHAIVPSAENMPGGRAYRPGDVLTMMSGLTVEVLNTDAEGRLILADALHYATTLKPRVIVDAATLTGACEIALGNHAIGMMGTDDGVMADLRAAGEETGERVWQLPLWDEYFEQIKNPVADIQNIGGRPAGTITAAAFLRKFVDDTPWAHLDIAGTAWETKGQPYKPRGATGIGVRLLATFVENLVS